MQADRNVIRVTPLDHEYLLKDSADKKTRRFIEDSSPFDSSDFYPYIENLWSQVKKKELICTPREKKLLAGIHVNFKHD